MFGGWRVRRWNEGRVVHKLSGGKSDWGENRWASKGWGEGLVKSAAILGGGAERG